MVLVFNAKKRLTLSAGVAGALAVLLDGCSSTPIAPAPEAGSAPRPAAPGTTAPTAPVDLNMPPPAPREFRAAWVSTVANIDWPSRNNLTMARQQAEALAILDRAQALHLNAIVLQVRPSADAIYPSELEPWSEFLTGQQGRAPATAWDPLQFWIEQAHARGLELHAWFNPYRARHATAKSPLARNHIGSTNPDVVKSYGRYLWMDPGEAAASQHTLDVVLDVVRRYDIDGVHIDDYFYPYPIDTAGADGVVLDAGASPKQELEFPDQPSWQRYLLGGGTLDRAGWRRQNVNSLIEALYLGIHKEKSWVRFGISPFGIGRPDRRPAGIVGFSQYDKLYADAELWLANGWLDYLAPQLYWPVAQAPQAFDVLLDYWLAQNTRARHVWPGLYTSRIDNSAKAFAPEEIVKQIGVTRSRAGVQGHLHFSIAALMENRKGIADQLRAQTYQTAALAPASPWLGAELPLAPAVAVRREGNGVGLKLSAAAGKPVAHYAIWSRYGSEWRFAVAPASRPVLLLPDDAAAGAAQAVVVSAIDRLGNESERVSVMR
ncbi:glycoside hydrolase family 10 protein [Duganella vulcania]|uniref:Family 10 glycosylhydrolase n=1 Tax=Duganella vulcania TaxID=2692166 RepID=A0A845GM44_9BURK|nr:family 10 glycosylhydrolase [Duganella vulcania]MYM93797.1 family 10 glycosylhydrolase [Duganella vulcania]